MSLSDLLSQYIERAENSYKGLHHEEFKVRALQALDKTIAMDELTPEEAASEREFALARIGESEADSDRMREEDYRLRQACIDHIVAFMGELKRPYLDHERMRALARVLGDYF